MSEKFILLVEDNSNDVALTIMALKKIQIDNRLVIVPDGREALSFLLSGEQDKPAVVVMDLKLPFIDGLEVLRQIREHESTRLLPVIILSASIDRKDRQKSIELGADDFHCKPISFNEFVKLMQEICAQWL